MAFGWDLRRRHCGVRKPIPLRAMGEPFVRCRGSVAESHDHVLRVHVRAITPVFAAALSTVIVATAGGGGLEPSSHPQLSPATPARKQPCKSTTLVGTTVSTQHSAPPSAVLTETAAPCTWPRHRDGDDSELPSWVHSLQQWPSGAWSQSSEDG